MIRGLFLNRTAGRTVTTGVSLRGNQSAHGRPQSRTMSTSVRPSGRGGARTHALTDVNRHPLAHTAVLMVSRPDLP